MANRTSGVAKTATEALKLFWERGYFRQWRKKGAIENHLSKSGYNFSGPELGMALKRAGHLTRKGKHGSYEYIQKHPFVAAIVTPVKKKRR
jgi:hypothetical protein